MQWIKERVDETAVSVRTSLDKYDAEKATQTLEALLDDLSNWYVRRSRRRFWKSEADADKNAAYRTLYHGHGQIYPPAGSVHPLHHRGDVPKSGAQRG